MSEETKVGQGGLVEVLPLWDASALAPNVRKRIIFGPGQFWDDYVMRHFTLPPGEKIPPHRHAWDHFVLSLEGHGRVVVQGEPIDLAAGRWGHVPPDVEHVFENPGNEDFVFVCIVPAHGDPHAKKTAMRAERAARKAAKNGAEEGAGTP